MNTDKQRNRCDIDEEVRGLALPLHLCSQGAAGASEPAGNCLWTIKGGGGGHVGG